MVSRTIKLFQLHLIDYEPTQKANRIVTISPMEVTPFLTESVLHPAAGQICYVGSSTTFWLIFAQRTESAPSFYS